MRANLQGTSDAEHKSTDVYPSDVPLMVVQADENTTASEFKVQQFPVCGHFLVYLVK